MRFDLLDERPPRMFNSFVSVYVPEKIIVLAILHPI